MPRKRKHIPLTQQLAAALACLLPQEQRDELRRRKALALEVRALFQFDHCVLHAHGGSDAWDNLTPMLVAPHREKSRRDTAIAAKVKRLAAKYGPQDRRSPVGLISFMQEVDRLKAEDKAAHPALGKGRGRLFCECLRQPKPKRKIAQRPPHAQWPPRGSRPLRRSRWNA